MTDTLKEIYRDNITLASVANTGSTTLLTTNTSTQFVIKDVNVGTALPGSLAPVLRNNTFAVGSLLTNSSGSEIVDVSSTLVAELYPTAPVFLTKSITLMNNTDNKYITEKFSTINEVRALSNTDVALLETGITSAITGGPDQIHNIAISNNGSVFWVRHDGNGVCSLYKRAGGINGNETTVAAMSYGWAVFNGIDTYYRASSDLPSQLYKYNINTGTETSQYAGTGSIASTSYPNAWYMNNGMILIFNGSSYGSTQVHITDPVPNAGSGAILTTNISGLPSVAQTGTNYKFSAHFDSVTNRYTIYRRFNTTLYKTVLNGVLTPGTAYSGGFTNSTIPITNKNNVHVAYLEHDSTNYGWGLHEIDGKTQVSVLNTRTGITTVKDFLPFRTNSHSFIITPSSANSSIFTNTSFPLRLSGVMIT